MKSIALANAMSDYKDIVIAIGYYTHPQTESIVEELRKQLGKKNICLDVSGMITARIPPKKQRKILALFPDIKEYKKFFGCTYTWMDAGYEERFDVKWHPQNVGRYGAPKERTGEAT